MELGCRINFDFEKADSFGFRIVKLLSKQLNASIVHLKNEKGTSFEMQIFPKTEQLNVF